MPSSFLALVVSPAEDRILAADLAGQPAGRYLLDSLADPEMARQTIVLDRAGAPAFASTDIAGDVLVIDARAWVSKRALADAAAQAVREQRCVCLMNAGRMLAVWLPTGAERPPSTDLAALLESSGVAVAVAHAPEGDRRVQCLDSIAALAEAEQDVLLERATDAMRRGVRIRDPRHVYLRGRLICGTDVEIDLGVVIEGTVTLGDGVRVGAHAILRDATIGDRTQIKPFSMVEEATIGAASQVGPYARIRPGTVIGERVQVGNYVELKSSRIGEGSRINHHTFIGDADLGENTTIGAGTITCNHDGVGVAHTIIERGAYIGSGCRLVAPVRIGQDATVGAGSTITRDVPPAKLTVARARQVTIEKWRGPRTRRKTE
jgi:bifunctional UDP-N-acetylglucosamine pyrophosphorylase/glucosamine-1-phosphate N-acetyltransferase